MVCARCKMAVTTVLQSMGMETLSVELGEVEVKGTPSQAQLEQLSGKLSELGFEIIDDKKSRLIEKIKNAIITQIHHSEENSPVNLSDYLSKEVNYDYRYLSNLFSEVEGTTIEKYFIAQKIEKVKELLKYDELTLSEIANKLGYSSVAYLSNQFKKQTGLTPSFFKSSRIGSRVNIEEL